MVQYIWQSTHKKNAQYHWRICVADNYGSDSNSDSVSSSVLIGVLDATFVSFYRMSNVQSMNKDIFVDRQRGYGIKPSGILMNYGQNYGKFCEPWQYGSI